MSKYSLFKKSPTLLKQFRSFCFQNKSNNINSALEYFSIFGGMSWDIDMNLSIDETIEKKVFDNYRYIHADITKITESDRNSHALLSGIATGDGRLHSALKKSRMSRHDAQNTLEKLFDMGFITEELSLETPPNDERVDEKLNFTKPFMRFWFSFVSPYFKGIRDGNYDEAKEKFTNKQQELSEFVFKKLAQDVIKASFIDDPIVEIGSYWDRAVEIDILAKTKSGKVIAGICKYSNQKAKKSELTKLKEQCNIAEINPDIHVVISKSGFSNELKALKSLELKLYALKNFKVLIDNLSKKDFLECDGKKY